MTRKFLVPLLGHKGAVSSTHHDSNDVFTFVIVSGGLGFWVCWSGMSKSDRKDFSEDEFSKSRVRPV